MAINYSIAQMKNPNDKGAPAKYYAKAQASGSVDINELAEEISYSTTLTDGDVLNVIRALVKQINKHISKGEIVKLENLGSFQAMAQKLKKNSAPPTSGRYRFSSVPVSVFAVSSALTT